MATQRLHVASCRRRSRPAPRRAQRPAAPPALAAGSLGAAALQIGAPRRSVLRHIEILKWSLELGIRVVWLILLDGDGDAAGAQLGQWLPLIMHLEPPRACAPLPRDVRRRLLDWYRQWGIGEQLHEEPHMRPLLCARHDGAELIVTDTRPCRVRARTVLTGLDAAVFDALDHAHTSASLMRALKVAGVRPASFGEVEPVLQRLAADKLILSIDDWYLGLAVQEPMRVLAPRPALPSDHANRPLLAPAGDW